MNIDDRLFDDEFSIKQISEATKWPFYQKSRPEEYDKEYFIGSRHKRCPILRSDVCMVVTFLIVWLAGVILLLRYG